MRKLLFTLMTGLFCCAYSVAQPIMGYTFTSSTGTYSEITDGTKMANPDDLTSFGNGLVWMGSTESTGDETTGAGFDIGFDFVYNNQKMNKFAIGSNFAIFLGKDEFTVDPSRHRWFLTDTEMPTLNIIQSAIPNWKNIEGKDGTEISYKLLGESPNRTLVVQFKNIGITGTGYEADLQIRLNETTNSIDFVYNKWNDQWTDDDNWTSVYVQIGLKGDDNDFITLANGDDYAWTSVEKSYTDNEIEWSKSYSPADGLTYTFLPGPDCETPTVQATSITVEAGSSVLNGSFTAAESGADRYLVLLTKGGAPTTTDLPVDGTTYKRLDVIGNSTVLGFSEESTFTTLDKWGESPEIEITPETTYCVSVIATNSLCSYGPKYNLTEVPQELIASAPAAPKSIKIGEKALKMLEVIFEGNESNHDVLVAYTKIPLRMDPHVTWLGTGVFGTPTGEYAVGDEIEGGGTVCYIGKAETEVSENVIGLEPNTVYHFMAWSKNAAGEYSTDTAIISDITEATVPFEFDLEAFFGGCEYGATTEGFTVANDKDGDYAFDFRKSTIDTDYTITTEWFTPAEGENRVMFDFTMWQQTGSTWMPTITPFTEWAEGEEFVIETSEDEATWTPVLTVNKDNAPAFEVAYAYSNQRATFESDGTPVKVRIRYTCKTGGVYAYLKNFRIEEKKACDYPVDLAVKEVVGDKATIIWEQQGNETQWLVEWRMADTEAWNSLTADTKEFTLKGLPGRSVVEVRVAAKCSETEVSDWSKTLSFTSGYVLPFLEAFTDDTISPEWEFMIGELTETGVEFEEGGWYATTNRFGGHFIMLEMPEAPANAWVLSPVLNFGEGDVNYTVTYELESIMTGGSEDEKVNIVVSTDGGKTFTTADVVLSEAAPGDGESQSYTATLKGYSGDCRLGLLITCETGTASYLQMKSMEIAETCPNDAVIVVDEVSGTSAKVSWTGTKDDSQDWMLYIRKQGEIEKNYDVKTQETSWEFTDLEPRTTYQVGVSKACAGDDIARPAIVTFTTLADDPCYAVEDLTATPDVYYVTFNWTFEAPAYNVRYREQGTEMWNEVKFQRPNMSIYDLKPATTYEYAMQTVCSDAEGDVSEWTETAVVTTLAETCFMPTNVQVETTHNKAVLSWDGTSFGYEIEYRMTSEEEYNALILSNPSFEMTELEPVTEYEFRVRGYCPDQPQTESLWTEYVKFTTAEIPVCAVPENLRVENVGENSATLLWDEGENNLTWDINWRASSETTYTEVLGLEDTQYELTNLAPKTSYIWRVKAGCDEGRVSEWSAQNKFTTAESGIEAITATDLNVYAAGSVLNVLNPENVFINNIEIYNVDGQLVGAYDINADQNVLINTNISNTLTLVKVCSGQQTLTFKVIFK